MINRSLYKSSRIEGMILMKRTRFEIRLNDNEVSCILQLNSYEWEWRNNNCVELTARNVFNHSFLR